MSWNDERVESLKRMHAEGLSASIIAARLGGITRNAVIGKLYRMGYSTHRSMPARRPSVNRWAEGAEKTWTPQRREHQANVMRDKLRNFNFMVAARKAKRAPPVQPSEPLPQTQELFVPLYNRRQLVDLEDGQCRWIIGDPKHPDHHYCDQHRKPGLSYCEFHARKAYQPLPERTGRPLILPERTIKVA